MRHPGATRNFLFHSGDFRVKYQYKTKKPAVVQARRWQPRGCKAPKTAREKNMGRSFDFVPPEQATSAVPADVELPEIALPEIPDGGGMPELTGPSFPEMSLPEASDVAMADLPEIPAAELPDVFDI
jgi:hypothetical protein